MISRRFSLSSFARGGPLFTFLQEPVDFLGHHFDFNFDSLGLVHLARLAKFSRLSLASRDFSLRIFDLFSNVRGRLVASGFGAFGEQFAIFATHGFQFFGERLCFFSLASRLKFLHFA